MAGVLQGVEDGCLFPLGCACWHVCRPKVVDAFARKEGSRRAVETNALGGAWLVEQGERPRSSSWQKAPCRSGTRELGE